ncbi:unnamed protein product [Eruca vesicaria subsp. sativa]|uniref:Uncharacterized protein n=1 Tax=Eruca vesicaria subsp. sativa TaxID=29727 RepID=A0ABC8IWW8_ERUVS|nr:unnamed protein product [Eruca vesicaria subsp. sativa]
MSSGSGKSSMACALSRVDSIALLPQGDFIERSLPKFINVFMDVLLHICEEARDPKGWQNPRFHVFVIWHPT